MKKIFVSFLVFLMCFLLVGCGENPPIDNSSSVDMSDISEETSTEQVDESVSVSEESNEQSEELTESDYYQSDPIISKSYTYEEFWKVYPEFLGEWRITEFCAHSRYVSHTAEYLMNNAVGEVLSMSEDGIEFLGNSYLPHSHLNPTVSIFSKTEIRTYGGYLDEDKVPLEDGVSYEFCCVHIDNPDFEHFEEKAFMYITFCKIDDDTLFLGIDDIHFVAERCVEQG